MIDYIKTWLALRLGRRAVTNFEFALIAGLLVATIFVGFNLLANNVSTKFSSTGTRL